MKKKAKLWDKLKKRDALLSEKEKEYGDEFPGMFNYPEIRAWYTTTICPLDEEIVSLANQVLSNYNKANIKNIRDVYNNDFLIKLNSNNIQPNKR